MPSHDEILGSLNAILCDSKLSRADCFGILAHLVAVGIVKLVNSWVDAEAKASKTEEVHWFTPAAGNRGPVGERRHLLARKKHKDA